MRARRVMQAVLAAIAMSAGAVSVAAGAGASGGALASVAVQDFSPSAPPAIGLTSDPQGNLYIASCNGGLSEIPANDPSHTAVPFATNVGISCATSVQYYGGFLFVADQDGGVIWRVTLDGASASIYSFGPVSGQWSPSQLAFGANGTLYVGNGRYSVSDNLFTIPWGGGVAQPLTTVPGCPWGLVSRDASLFVGDRCDGVVESLPNTGGSVSLALDPTQFSPEIHTSGQLAADPAGNVFFLGGTGCGSGSGRIMEIPAGSNTAVVVPATGYSLDCTFGSGITWSNGYVYIETNGLGDIARFPDPISTAVTHLAVTRDWTTLTGTWDGAPGAISYTCTLLYGFGGPSSFTTIVRTPTCSFYGLTPSTNFGISVVANYASGSSSPVGAFPLQAPTIITCVRGHSKVHVRAWNPRCPAHYHRVGRPVQG